MRDKVKFFGHLEDSILHPRANDYGALPDQVVAGGEIIGGAISNNFAGENGVLIEGVHAAHTMKAIGNDNLAVGFVPHQQDGG